MLIAHLILAAIAVGALVATRPGRRLPTVVAALAATVDLALGAPLRPALMVSGPLLLFLTAALTLASLVERSGLAERLAAALASAARGSALLLYVLVCALCGLLTAAVSLDGAVVLMVPLLLVLARRFRAPFAPLFLGAVVVANAASIAVPQGNPTNLVIIARLGLSPAAFVAHMLAPGVSAAIVCAAAVALLQRRALTARVALAGRGRAPLSAGERHAALSLSLAAIVAWAAPLLGIAPWWPFAGAVALALLTERRRPRLVVPWNIGIQVSALVVVTSALHVTVALPTTTGLGVLLVVAALIGLACATLNNLPVSVWAAGLLSATGPAYAASIGLAVGSLATSQGSVATLIAVQLAGSGAPRLSARRLAPIAAAGLVAATTTLWAML